MSVFKNFWCVEMPNYKIVVFSTSKEASTLEDNEIEDMLEDLKRSIDKEYNKIEDTNAKVFQKISSIETAQTALSAKLSAQFTHLKDC